MLWQAPVGRIMSDLYPKDFSRRQLVFWLAMRLLAPTHVARSWASSPSAVRLDRYSARQAAKLGWKLLPAVSHRNKPAKRRLQCALWCENNEKRSRRLLHLLKVIGFLYWLYNKNEVHSRFAVRNIFQAGIARYFVSFFLISRRNIESVRSPQQSEAVCSSFLENKLQ